MQRLVIISLALSFVLGMTWVGFAAEKQEVEQKWIDITEKVLANPADKGGWTEDAGGKIFRSDDGNWIKVEHSEYGTYIVDLPNKKVMKVKGDAREEMKNTQLIQRDFGTSLVIKGDTHKFRLKFNEKVSGMSHIEGIKGM